LGQDYLCWLWPVVAATGTMVASEVFST